MAESTVWRVLVVDDREANEVVELIAGNKVFEAPYSIEAQTVMSFGEAMSIIDRTRVDLVILDLKDDNDNEDEDYPGNTLHQEIKQKRFVPVVFHTAWPQHVETPANPFVKIVQRGDDPAKLRDAIKEVFATNLPQLIRHLEDAQRKYMWDFLDANWNQINEGKHRVDLAYLLARQLAAGLQRDSIRHFLKGSALVAEEDQVDPVELYIHPHNGSFLAAGDILVASDAKEAQAYWIVLTPSCDLVPRAKPNREPAPKAEFVLLAKCLPLKEFNYYKDALSAKSEGKFTRKKAGELTSFLLGGQSQSDRLTFLPGTFFLPDLIVDIQQINCMSVSEVSQLQPVASLDAPFGEAILNRLSRFYGRVGTPDLAIDVVLDRLGLSADE